MEETLMRPVLFQVGSIEVYTYGLMVALGFALATLSLIEIFRKQADTLDSIVDFALWTLVAAILGARTYYVVAHHAYYLEHPIEILMLNRGGLVFYGGLAGGIAGAVLYCRKQSWPLLDTGDYVLAVLPIGQMFGRMGCFLNGCCFGAPTLFPIRFTYPLGSLACDYYQELQPVHPVQLYEAFGLGLLYLLLMFLHDKKQFPGQVMALYGMGYGTLRFMMEFLRGDSLRYALGWTLSGWISVALILFSSIAYAFLLRRKR
jgi:phosphatidylglycerol:prolipoprotein diacylglycerol transferase